MKNYRILFVLLLAVALACRNDKKYHDAPRAAPAARVSGPEDVLAFREALNREFRDPETSPLPDRHRKDFESLDFFEPGEKYRVVARFVRTPEAIPFMMPTTTERVTEEVVYGMAYFHLDGKEHALEVYRGAQQGTGDGKHALFLPFLDETNGMETYDGGRYLDLPMPQGDSLIIDFNKAYNPYCAYNKKYSCPIVPEVNRVHTAIRAGGKAFKND